MEIWLARVTLRNPFSTKDSFSLPRGAPNLKCLSSLLIAMSDFFLRIKSRELWVEWVGDNVFPLLILLYWPSWIGLLLFILGIQFNHNLNNPRWLILLQKLSQQRKHFWSVLLFCQSKHSDFACCEMFAPPVFSLF